MNLKAFSLSLILFPLFITQNLFSEESSVKGNETSVEVIVLADKEPYKKNEVATSITVIDSKKIGASQQENVVELLKGEAGIDVVQSGGSGGSTAIFIRGANSEHTLVYIDGISANDPVTPTRTFDFANFSTDNIEKIEIIRGSQGLLYGSDAIGGVILITTKRGKGSPSGKISAEAGSYGTFIEKGTVSGGDDSVSYSFAVSQMNTDGFSAADKRDGNLEEDGYESTNMSSSLRFYPTENIEGGIIARFTDARSELDNFGGIGGDDPNRVINDQQLFSRGEIVGMYFDGFLKQKIGFSFTDQWYDDNNYFDETHPTDSLLSSYQGIKKSADILNTLKLSESFDAIVGYENSIETGSSSLISESSFGPYTDILDDSSITTNGYFLQGRWDHEDRLTLTAGGRIDDNSKFGSNTSWKAGPSYLINDTRFFGTVGTGYKAPSIFQLFSSFGNELLEAEESRGYDLGIEQKIADSMIGITYFNNNFDNLITFNPDTFISENILEAKSDGIETFITTEISSQIEGAVSYTYTDTKDETTGEALLRRARNKGKLTLSYIPSDKLKFGITLFANGERVDNDFSTFPATRSELSGYSVTNITGEYKLDNNFEIFSRIDNLFDKNYQDVLGFGTKVFSLYGGIRYRY